MVQAQVRFTIKGEEAESVFVPVNKDNSYYLFTEKSETHDEQWIPLSYDNGRFTIDGAGKYFEEDEEVIFERLKGLSAEWMESSLQGFEGEGDSSSAEQTEELYSPDDIFVENKPFSLQQLMDLIEAEDIELNPNFQRHFIWDTTRQSKLIESIFLGLPLPSLYFSQYNDGRLTVVDGLQRLTTIRRFLQDKLTLYNLEYLKDCNGKKYSQLKNVLTPLRLRRFAQTPMMCFVIDYRSPGKLKYDLFRRLNTGGKPLNNQEIRNCLSRPNLQKALTDMIKSDEFKTATDGSIKNSRMEAQETALRYMYFYGQYTEDNPTGTYNGNIDDTLDDEVERLNTLSDFSEFTETYKSALKNAYKLFGRFAFRKVYPDYLEAKRNQINKLLMMSITVLLAKNEAHYQSRIEEKPDLTKQLATLIHDDSTFYEAITWSTNSKANIRYVMRTLKSEIFDKYLI